MVRKSKRKLPLLRLMVVLLLFSPMAVSSSPVISFQDGSDNGKFLLSNESSVDAPIDFPSVRSELADVDDDGLLETAFNDNGDLTIVDKSGNAQFLVQNAGLPSGTGKLAVGDKNNDDVVEIYYPNTADSSYIYKVTKQGNPQRVTSISGSAASAVIGIADFNQDGDKDIVFVGTSQTIKYLDNQAVQSTQYSGIGINRNVGVGPIADYNGNGVPRVPVVDGSQIVSLIDSSGNKEKLNNNLKAKKDTLGAYDISSDGNPEIFYTGTSGEMNYFFSNGTSKSFKTSSGQTLVARSIISKAVDTQVQTKNIDTGNPEQGAFGYDPGDPLPNVTDYRVFDVSGLSTSEKRDSGQLVHSGLNETVDIDKLSQGDYRFSFEVTNEGASTWQLTSQDELFHDNVPDTWTREQTYYNTSGSTFFGGNLSGNTINWDAGQGGSVDVGQKLYAEYIVEVPEQDYNLQQQFLVNDSESGAGSRDFHRLKVKDLGNLDVEIHEPPNNTVVQINKTFDINATATCSGGFCGDINADPRYNESGARTVIRTSTDDPFRVQNFFTGNCDDVSSGEKCRLVYLVNATGTEGSRFNLDVNVSSNYTKIPQASSNNSLVGLNSFILMGLNWSVTNFGYVEPGAVDQPAVCSVASFCPTYNVVIENYSIPVDALWVKGSDLISQENPAYEIGIGNVSYSLINDSTTSEPIRKSYRRVATDLAAGTILPTYYWLDVPTGIVQSQYSGQITFKANNSG